MSCAVVVLSTGTGLRPGLVLSSANWVKTESLNPDLYPTASKYFPVPAGTVTETFNARPENVRTAQKDGGDGRLNDWMEGDKVYRLRKRLSAWGVILALRGILAATADNPDRKVYSGL